MEKRSLAERNRRRNKVREDAVNNAAIEFDKKELTAQEKKMFLNLSGRFSSLSYTVQRYLFMCHREEWLLMSIELDDPKAAHDKWTLHFVRLMARMGPDTLRSFGNENPGIKLYKLVQKYDRRRKRLHRERFKKSVIQKIRPVENGPHTQKDRIRKRLLPAKNSNDSSRRAPGALL